jgi:hypothetical protein
MTPEERAALIDDLTRGLEVRPYGLAVNEASRRLDRLWRTGSRVVGSPDFAVVLRVGELEIRASHLELFGSGLGGVLAALRATLRQRCPTHPACDVEVLEVKQGDAIDQGRLLRVDEDSRPPWGCGWYRKGPGGWEPWKSDWDTSR